MNVAIFTDNDFDKVNGVTTTLNAVLRYAPPDVQPRIYTAANLSCDTPEYLALRSLGVAIPFYSEMKMYVPRWRTYLARVLEARVEVLHLTTPGPIGLAALWIAQHTGLPLVGSFHTDLAAYTRVLSGSDQLSALMRVYMRWMYGRCARVFVPSDATRRLLVEADTPPTRLHVWTRGVDTNAFAPARRSVRLREAWRVSDRRPAVLYVGRVSREKGLDLLPGLSAGLHASGVDHRLIIAGDGPMRRELASACPDAIFTGALGREQVANVFASADLFVFPSRTDTAGNVVLEAQASGLPVMVSNEGGPRENIVNGSTGLVCTSSDLPEWVESAARLLREHDVRHAMGAAAREYALSRRWDTALTPLYQAYRELAGSRPRNGTGCAAVRRDTPTLALDPEVPAGLSAVGVLRLLLQQPWRYVGRRWNYKSAITSGCFRGALFFVVNLSGGMEAAVGALSAEFWLRFLTAGYYGALTQAFRRVEPERQAVISALILVPALGHLLELIVHSARGTPNLEASIGASMVFTVVSTSFSLFAMRRGAFTTGPGSQSLLHDLLQLPALLVAFVCTIVRGLVRV